jgi:type II secretory pathway predicted ATPase ExeA
MIRAHYGLNKQPFHQDKPTLLPQQSEIIDSLRVHCQHGGFSLIVGEPGTGKSTLKDALREYDPKRILVPTVSRTLHTYTNIVRILCQAFSINTDGDTFKCEKRLIEEAHRINKCGKMLMPVIDEAHLIDSETLRKIRLLLEDFPKNHNLILIGQPYLLRNLQLSINEDIKSRVTYSEHLQKLNPEDAEKFILDQLDQCGLAHSTFTEDALALIIRQSEGTLRYLINLCLCSLIETIRAQTKTLTIKHVNNVLRQPHWRKPQHGLQ